MAIQKKSLIGTRTTVKKALVATSVDPTKIASPNRFVLTPQKLTPQKLTPQKLTPQKLTPQKLTPQKLTPQKLTPQKLTPQKLI
jgi:hypothetical protein